MAPKMDLEFLLQKNASAHLYLIGQIQRPPLDTVAVVKV